MSHFFNGFIPSDFEDLAEDCRCKRYSPSDPCGGASGFVTCRPCCRPCPPFSPYPPCPPVPCPPFMELPFMGPPFMGPPFPGCDCLPD